MCRKFTLFYILALCCMLLQGCKEVSYNIDISQNPQRTDIACLYDAVVIINEDKLSICMPEDIEEQRDYLYLTWWKDIVSIYSCDGNCLTGIDKSGKPHFWGECGNYCYELADDNKTYQKIIASNNYAAFLDTDGIVDVVYSRYNGFFESEKAKEQYKEWNDIVDIAMNADCVVVLGEDGKVNYLAVSDIGKPYDTYYQGIQTWNNIMNVELTANGYIIGLDCDGNIKISNGSDERNGFNLRNALKWNDIKKISAEGDILVGLDNEGKVYACGDIDQETIISIETWRGVTDISAGPCYIVGIENNGNIHIINIKKDSLIY
ncbi:MAG: hypothetical protein IKU06_11785 [Lachnospiraceae bacterium]|nr:hypothetical protein [Lachnospiraceae bacterium]